VGEGSPWFIFEYLTGMKLFIACMIVVCHCLMQAYFDEHIDEEKYCGYLYGFGTTAYNGNGYNMVTEDSQ
jgi:hypothetical protein